MDKQISRSGDTYMIYNDNQPYLGLDIADWKGPCVQCGNKNFSLIYPNKRRFRHFCSSGCAMCFDLRKPQPTMGKKACKKYLDNCL